MINERAIRERYETIRDQLDERGRRLFAAAEARSVGRGGVMAVCRATGLARSTIERGLKDLDQPAPPAGRVRRAAGGGGPRGGEGAPAPDSKGSTAAGGSASSGRAGHAGRPDATAAVGLQEPRQTRQSASEDGPRGQPEHGAQVAGPTRLWPRANRKANDGRQHADRDAQFEHIN